MDNYKNITPQQDRFGLHKRTSNLSEAKQQPQLTKTLVLTLSKKGTDSLTKDKHSSNTVSTTTYSYSN